MLVRLNFAVRSNVPSQLDRKNRAGPAIQGHNRPHAPEAPPTPTQPMATRNRRAVPGRIATLPALQSDLPCRLDARQKENDRNRESRPAEFQHATDPSSGDEFAP